MTASTYSLARTGTDQIGRLDDLRLGRRIELESARPCPGALFITKKTTIAAATTREEHAIGDRPAAFLTGSIGAWRSS